MAKSKGATAEDTMTDTQNDAETQSEPQGTEQGTEATENGENKAERAKTVYFGLEDMEAVEDLPDQVRAKSAGRSRVYFNLLEKVAEQGVDNKWRPLAKFGTGTGARTVATTLNKQVDGKIGEGKGQVKPDQVRDIPAYEGHRWVFDARRVPGEGDTLNSILYCKLVEVE